MSEERKVSLSIPEFILVATIVFALANITERLGRIADALDRAHPATKEAK